MMILPNFNGLESKLLLIIIRPRASRPIIGSLAHSAIIARPFLIDRRTRGGALPLGVRTLNHKEAGDDEYVPCDPDRDRPFPPMFGLVFGVNTISASSWFGLAYKPEEKYSMCFPFLLSRFARGQNTGQSNQRVSQSNSQ